MGEVREKFTRQEKARRHDSLKWGGDGGGVSGGVYQLQGGCEGRHTSSLPVEKWSRGEMRVDGGGPHFYSQRDNVERWGEGGPVQGGARPGPTRPVGGWQWSGRSTHKRRALHLDKGGGTLTRGPVHCAGF
jgi:hypothetical protein